MVTWELEARGLVQGVGYRWFVQHTALQFGICGYVRNQSDGSVYIVAQGEDTPLEGFAASLKAGNRFSRVESLYVNKIDHAKIYHEFEIR